MTKTPKIGTAAWKLFVVKAAATDPVKRTAAQREALAVVKTMLEN